MAEDNFTLQLLINRLKERGSNIELPVPHYQLPLWDDLSRAIPNHLARSSLFAPIRRGCRKRHERTELASRSDVKILYSGPQLDEADRDVFFQLLYEARKVSLGQRIYINRAVFLRTLGRATGKMNYEWLHGALGRLFEGALFIETKRYKIGRNPSRVEDWMHLVDRVRVDEETETYYFELDPRIKVLFGNHEYALIDWNKRLQLKHHADMAKWLQCLVATSDGSVQRYRVAEIKDWMAYTGRMRDFKPALIVALNELERLEIIATPHFDQGVRGQELMVWNRLGGPQASG